MYAMSPRLSRSTGSPGCSMILVSRRTIRSRHLGSPAGGTSSAVPFVPLHPCCRVFLTRLTLLTVLCNQSLVNSSFFSHSVQAFRIVLLLPHCDSLQFKVSPDKERPRTDEFARGIIFRREVARVNGIELLEQRQIRARDLHVHQII